MAVVIRMTRAGAKKRPFFRMVAADSRARRDGRFLEILGHYNPLTQPHELVVHKDKVEHWLARGAQPSEQVASLLRRLGIVKPQAQVRVEGVEGVAAVVEPKVKRAAKKAAARKAAGKATGTGAVKRAAPRKVSTRRADRKVARKTAKKTAKKA